MSARYEIVLDSEDGFPVVRARGELDQLALEALESRFAEAAALDRGVVVLSLLDSTYFDSLTVHAIMSFRGRLEFNRQKLIICVPEHGTPRRILEISGVATRVPLFTSLAEAAAAARSISPRSDP